MKRALYLGLLIVVLTACSTVSRDMTFDGGSGEAFVLVVADGMTINGSEGYAFNFERVDLANSTFKQEFSSVSFSGMGAIEGNEFKKPESMDTTLRFGGRTMAPGDYVLTSRTDSRAAGMSSFVNQRCFSHGAPAYRVVAGKTNVIPAGNVKTLDRLGGEDAVSKSGEVLAGYPNMNAPRILAQQVGFVTFQTGKNLGTEICRKRGIDTFVYTPSP